MSLVLSQRQFQIEALGIIRDELLLATAKGYLGVAFEGGRDEIWLYYTNRGSYTGQEKRYPNALWPDMCLACRLIGQTAHRCEQPKFVNLAEGVGFNSARWSIYPSGIGAETLDRILERVDQVITLLQKPL